jgi:hypothetical protein
MRAAGAPPLRVGGGGSSVRADGEPRYRCRAPVAQGATPAGGRGRSVGDSGSAGEGRSSAFCGAGDPASAPEGEVKGRRPRSRFPALSFWGARRAPHHATRPENPLTTGPGNGSPNEAARLPWVLSDMPTEKRVLTEPLRGGTRRGPNAGRKVSARPTSLQVGEASSIGGGWGSRRGLSPSRREDQARPRCFIFFRTWGGEVKYAGRKVSGSAPVSI